METAVRDLWPDDIATTDMVAPVTILHEQASVLSDRTSRKVKGEIQSHKTPGSGTDIVHVFYLTAPALGDYKYRLFSIYHGPDLYPLTISFPEKGQEKITVASETEFMERLKEIFSDPSTKKVVHSLIAQSRKSLD